MNTLQIVLAISFTLNMLLIPYLITIHSFYHLGLPFKKPKNLCGRCCGNKMVRMQSVGGWVNYLCTACAAYKWRNESIPSFKSYLCLDEDTNHQGYIALTQGSGMPTNS